MLKEASPYDSISHKWSTTLDQRLNEAQQHRDSVRQASALPNKSRYRDFATFNWLTETVTAHTSEPLHVWQSAWARPNLCNVCLKSTAPGYARLECMSCDVVVHRACMQGSAVAAPPGCDMFTAENRAAVTRATTRIGSQHAGSADSNRASASADLIALEQVRYTHVRKRRLSMRTQS